MGTQLRTRLNALRLAGGQHPAQSAWAARMRFLVPLLVFAVAALAGGVLAVQGLVSPPEAATLASAESMGNADGLWFTVQSAVWVGQDRQTEQRVSVSAGPNPAARPHGLQVEIKVQNRGDGTRILGPQEFRLQAQNGTTSNPTGRTFPLTLLGPRQYLHSVLSFDVPETPSDMQLLWNRSGREVRVLVKAPVPGAGNARADGKEVSSCLPTIEVRCADGARPSTSRTGGN